MGKRPGTAAALFVAWLLAGCGTGPRTASAPAADVPGTLQETYWKDFTVSVVRPTVDEFRAAGVDIRLTDLEGHDHDVWTDTYSDPEYYDWFLQFHKS